MLISPKAWRILIDGFLWVVIAVCIWFMLTKHFVAFFAVSGRWQTPGFSRVHVGSVQRDQDSSFTDFLISVNSDGSQKLDRLLKEELTGVQPGDAIWLIHAPYVTITSPPSYRFTLFRLVMEFPEFFALVCGCWLFSRFRGRLGKPFDAYEGNKKPTVTYVDPSPDSWGRSKSIIAKKDQGDFK